MVLIGVQPCFAKHPHILVQQQQGGLFFGSWNNAEVIKVAKVELLNPMIGERIILESNLVSKTVQHLQNQFLRNNLLYITIKPYSKIQVIG